MALEKPLGEYDTVKAWSHGLQQQWSADVLAEEPEQLQALEEFCALVGEDPDAIVGKLFRIRKSDGERVLSNKWRTHYADKVKGFRARTPGNDGQRKGASVLSFMIHNGVLIQA